MLGYNPRRMDYSLWGRSLTLYRAFGIAVRIHWTFILLPLILILDTSRVGLAGQGMLLFAGTAVMILLHEYGHALTARRLGAEADEIVLGMFGGAATCGHGRTPGEDILISFAGPMVNILLLGGLLVPIALTDGEIDFHLLNPFAPWGADLWVWLYKMNVVLLAFNLLVPVIPLDGGRILTGLISIRAGRPRAFILAAPFAVVIGLALLGLGLLTGEFLLAVVCAWIVLDALRLRRLAKMGAIPDYPGTETYGPSWQIAPNRDFESRPSRPGLFERMRQKLRSRKQAKARERDARLREDVDAILDKVSREGMESLTPQERRRLEEASRKIRDG